MYNVEQYVAECLASLEGQTFRDLEVIMLDDGSTDATAEIASGFSARDSRFRLVQQENAGLGAARNAGVRAADPGSRYLTFVDADDAVPEYAYQLCVETLDETGSDFVSGNVHLLDSRGTYQSPMHRGVMATTRLKVHVSRDKELINDRLAPNKVFRRAFWEKHSIAFPEGVLYEDTPAMVPAHFLAEKVDILSTPTYYWRQREGASLSITQRRTEPAAVRDRIAAVDAVSRFLAAQPGREYAEYKRWYDKSALVSDINIFIRLLPEVDDAYRERFLDLANDFLSRVDPTVVDELPAVMRLKWYLIAKRRMPELLEVLAYEKKNPGGSIPILRRFRRYAKYPFFRDPTLDVPDKVYRLGQELNLFTRTTDISWRGDRLLVTGYAYVKNINVHKQHMSMKAFGLRSAHSRRIVVRPARTVQNPEATARSGQARYCYDWSGFEVAFDANSLKIGGKWVDTSWRMAVGVLSRGLLRRSRLGAGVGGTATHPPIHYVADNVRIVPSFVRGRLRIGVETVRARVIGHAMVDGDVLELTGSYFGTPPASAESVVMRLEREPSPVALDYPVVFSPAEGGSSRFVVRVPAADLVAARRRDLEELPSFQPAAQEIWRTSLIMPGEEKPLKLAIDDDLVKQRYPVVGPGRELVPARNAPGHLLLQDRLVYPLVDTVAWSDDGRIIIEGEYPRDDDTDVRLVCRYRGHHEEHVFPLKQDNGRFRVELTPAGVPMMGSDVPMRSGLWDMSVRVAAEESGRRNAAPALAILPSMAGQLPLEKTVNGRRYQLGLRAFDQLLLTIDTDLGDTEFGPYRQKLLRERLYPQALQQPLREAVLYDSYTGKQFSDTPRAVYEELVRRGSHLEHFWIVRDQQVVLPEGITPVRMWGKEWYEALARCRYIITNAHLPDWIQRRDGQVVVQAWHGTPLKKIGWDIEDVQFANGDYLQKVARESENWSFMVSPNRFSTPILERAMRFEGEILEAGYPRNDVIYAPDRDERAVEVRRRIGVPEGKRVILYAPTWRDDQFYGPGRYKLNLQIDLRAARAALGDDYVLLVRKHPNVADSVPGAGDGFVFDVSAFPDINELFLATDVLVTDYSSLMFDFANTGRPMLFFTYDLEHYRDKLRGFYFDFEQRAPGPLIATSDELIQALRDVDVVAEKYRTQYDEFQRDFCDLDDGHAAGRVIDRMLELGG